MNIDISLITGASLGVEFIGVDEAADISCPCVVVDLLFIRIVLEFIQK